MSQWPRLRFNSPAWRLFTQPFIQTQIKENIKAPRHWPLCGEFTGTGEFPAQMASYEESVSIWWRHHALVLHGSYFFVFQLLCLYSHRELHTESSPWEDEPPNNNGIDGLLTPWGPFYWHGLTLIPAWTSNHMPHKVWDEITYPFLNFNSCTVEVLEGISNFIPHFIMDVITYPCWDKK